MKERDRQRLRDILRAIESILRYRPENAGAFHEDELLQSHFKLKLQVIGEAASRLDEETRASAGDIPWRKINGMRNILAHDYEGIDLDIAALVEQVRELGLQPYQAPEPLPVIEEDEIQVCWIPGERWSGKGRNPGFGSIQADLSADFSLSQIALGEG